MPNRTSLLVELRPGEVITLFDADGRRVTVTLEEKSGQRARMRVEAPLDVRIAVPERRQAA